MVLKSIDTVIIFYQSDSVPILEVYSLFANKLPNAILSIPLISTQKHDNMLQLNLHQFNFKYSNAHGIENLLNL